MYDFGDDEKEFRRMVDDLNEASDWTGLFNNERAFDEAAHESLDAQCAAAISGLRGDEVTEIGKRAYLNAVYKWHRHWAVPTLTAKCDALERERRNDERGRALNESNAQAEAETEKWNVVGAAFFFVIAAGIILCLGSLLVYMWNHPEWANKAF